MGDPRTAPVVHRRAAVAPIAAALTVGTLAIGVVVLLAPLADGTVDAVLVLRWANGLGKL